MSSETFSPEFLSILGESQHVLVCLPSEFGRNHCGVRLYRMYVLLVVPRLVVNVVATRHGEQSFTLRRKTQDLDYRLRNSAAQIGQLESAVDSKKS